MVQLLVVVFPKKLSRLRGPQQVPARPFCDNSQLGWMRHVTWLCTEDVEAASM
jgi:hypothetical protein